MTALRSVTPALTTNRQMHMLLLGKGTVGGHLLDQIRDNGPEFVTHYGINLRVIGILGRSAAVRGNPVVDLHQWREALTPLSAEDAWAQGLERLRALPGPVLVDCTGADGMERVYAAAFDRGIHVVTANKKPLAIDWPAREVLLGQAHRARRAFRYETTVGAGLPIIGTLKDLVRTGDRIERIEGALSGTLGFLTASVSNGVPLSRATQEAIERGYAEPNPQDDLSGVDVARKALILTRELGIELELDDVHVEPLVPATLLHPTSAHDFLGRLRSHDAVVAARVAQLHDQGLRLRYLLRIEPGAAGTATVRVGAVGVDDAHAAARLRGPEALVAFTTQRYHEFPVVVQGAGAGGAVTAAGLLADLLHVASADWGG